MQLKAGLLSLALLLGTAAGCATGGSAGRAAPERFDLALPDLSGKQVKLTDFAGQVVLVDLWATWCKPCEASMPFYAELQRRLGPRGFKVLAVSVDEDDADVTRWVEGRDLPFTILRDPGGSVPAQLAIDTMPTAVIVGRDGKVVQVHGGFVAGDEANLEARVSAALDAPPQAIGEPGAPRP